MRIGFIGTGAISQHVIVGLIERGDWNAPVFLSPRNVVRSAALASRFDNVQVAESNQGVVDRSDIIFLAVLPGMGEEVLGSLSFHAGQSIVSMVAGLSVEQIKSNASDVGAIHRIIPMPPNEHGVGPIPVFPPSPALKPLLDRIGTTIQVDDESHFSTYSASSALMALFFELTAVNARWIEANGVSSEHAATYSTSLFHSLATMTRKHNSEALTRLSRECLTSGGLNEQMLEAAVSLNWFDLIPVELDKILDRISG